MTAIVLLASVVTAAAILWPAAARAERIGANVSRFGPVRLRDGLRAGTKWGPLWCPQCDVVRLDRVSAGFAAIKAYSDQTKQPARLHMPDQDTQTDRSPQGEST